MQSTINGKQLDVGDVLQGCIEDQLLAIVGKYFENLIDGHVTISKKGSDIRDDVTIHVGKRLQRYKRQLCDRYKERSYNSDTLPALQYVFAVEKEGMTIEPDQSVMVVEMETEIEAITSGDEVMWMALADLPALMSHNMAYGGLNMVYRRANNNIGWVDPRGLRGGVPERG
jgi:hypothetical protein